MRRRRRRRPEHYPLWLRKLLFDPMERLTANYTNNTERNLDTLYKIHMFTYRMDPKDALIFDMIVEMERKAIDDEERYEAIKKSFLALSERMEKLEKLVERKAKVK